MNRTLAGRRPPHLRDGIGADFSEVVDVRDADARADSEPIRVIVRVRPPLPSDLGRGVGGGGGDGGGGGGSAVRVHPDGRTLSLTLDRGPEGGGAPRRSVTCRYDRVLGERSSQEEAFAEVSRCADAVSMGRNATVLAYGQTGTGKSHTMFGSDSDYEGNGGGSGSPPEYGGGEALLGRGSGVVPRCVVRLFDVLRRISSSASSRAQVSEALVYVSFVQIYNDRAYDMFRDPDMRRPLEMREDSGGGGTGAGGQRRGTNPRPLPSSPRPRGGVYLPGVSEFTVRSADECLRLLALGLRGRSVRETRMNRASSRSHSIFRVTVERSSEDGAGRVQTTRGRIDLVDLAGSERWDMGKDLGMDDKQVGEMTNINSR